MASSTGITSLRTMAYHFKAANPDANIGDFLTYIAENKQGCKEGHEIAQGFMRALNEAGKSANGDYRFS